MNIVVALLLIVVTSVHAFGVLPALRPRAAAAAFHLPPFKIMSAQDSAGYTRQDPDYELACVIEDDEWMRLTIQLTQAVYGQVKSRVVAIMDEDQVDVQKLEDAGLEIEEFVRAEVTKLRTAFPSADELTLLTNDLVGEMEHEIRQVTGDASFTLGDWTKEAAAVVMTAITDFNNGKSLSVEEMKQEITNRVAARVNDAKKSTGYEYWKFKKDLEQKQDDMLQDILEPEEYLEIKNLREMARDVASSFKGALTKLFFAKQGKNVSEWY